MPFIAEMIELLRPRLVRLEGGSDSDFAAHPCGCKCSAHSHDVGCHRAVCLPSKLCGKCIKRLLVSRRIDTYIMLRRAKKLRQDRTDVVLRAAGKATTNESATGLKGETSQEPLNATPPTVLPQSAEVGDRVQFVHDLFTRVQGDYGASTSVVRARCGAEGIVKKVDLDVEEGSKIMWVLLGDKLVKCLPGNVKMSDKSGSNFARPTADSGINHTAARPTAGSGINHTAATPTADSGIDQTAARSSRRSRRGQVLSEGAPVPICTRIDVLWDQDEWYAGILTDYNIINGLSQLLYDDADNKWHDLTVDHWRPSSKKPLEQEPLAPTAVASVQAPTPAATCSSTLIRGMSITEVTAHTIVAANEGWTLNMCTDGWPWDTKPIPDILFCLFDITLLSLSREVLSKVVQVSKQCQNRGRFSDLPPNMMKPAANQAFGGK